MSVLTFTPADALQTVTVEAGTYPAEISKIEGPKASNSGKSVSYFVDIEVTDGKFKGKTFTIILNTGTKNASLLGTMQFFPDNAFLMIDAAIGKKKIEAVNQDVDTDDLMHKPFDVVIGIATVEGRLINLVNNFLPAGSGSEQRPW